MDLIQRLMEQLNLDEGTARSGLGLVLKVATERLEGEDMVSVKDLIPETDDLIKEAPKSGLMGYLGDLGRLLGGFSKLGINKDAATKFAGVVGEYVQEHGDDNLKGLVSSLLDKA